MNPQRKNRNMGKMLRIIWVRDWMIMAALLDGYGSIRIETMVEFERFVFRIKRIYCLLFKGAMLPWGTQKCPLNHGHCSVIYI